MTTTDRTTPGAGQQRTDPTSYDAMPLAPREFGRWIWRQLTSMRTALILLFLLAVAAVPGSVVPQEGVDAFAVSQWREKHPDLAPLYDKLGLFHVYGSAWFSAIYLLLMLSLVGCIVPRCRVYLDGLRAKPPRPPRNLDRLPEHRSFEVDDEPEAVLTRARTALRGFRRIDATDDQGRAAVAAERGYLREAGNLLFHLSVLVVLVGFAVGVAGPDVLPMTIYTEFTLNANMVTAAGLSIVLGIVTWVVLYVARSVSGSAVAATA